MKTKDLFEISFQNFKNRQSRIFFTILGVSVAIAAVLFLVSFGYGLQSSLLEKITTTDSLLTLDIMSPDTNLIKINQTTIDKIKKIDHVEEVSPYVTYPGNITLDDLSSEIMTHVIDKNYFNFEGISPKTGRLFSSSDKNKIIVNSSIAQLYNLKDTDLIGKKVKIVIYLPNTEEEDVGDDTKTYKFDNDFEIAGIIESSDSQGYVYVQDKDITIPIEEYLSAKIKVDQSSNLGVTRENLTTMGFFVSALSDTINQANKIFKIIQIILGIFGTVALVVAAIGLINTMTISLLERTNEIGIMRAIGAAPKDIMWLFLGESFIIGFLGGFFGVILGVGVGQLFEVIINFISHSLGGGPVKLFSYPIWFIFFIIILSSVVGLIGGFFPARRASKLNPLDALRYK